MKVFKLSLVSAFLLSSGAVMVNADEVKESVIKLPDRAPIPTPRPFIEECDT